VTDTTSALVLGASSDIAQAIITALISDPEIGRVVAVSRKPVPANFTDPANPTNEPLWIESGYSEAAMAKVVEQLQPFSGCITRVVICNGLLHSETVWPEKRLEDINADVLQAVFQANTVVPTLWLKLLHSVLKGKQRCVVAAISARVGSIGDNYLGGWYAYRSSKAALNMLVRNLSIELPRRCKPLACVSLHPGTTESALSEPFSQSLAKLNVHTPEETATNLLEVLDGLGEDDNGKFLSWDGTELPW